MRSMQVKAFLDVSNVEISFSGGMLGARVVARVAMHQSVNGRPHVSARPNEIALSWQASSELVDKIRELIEAEGFEAILGSDIDAVDETPRRNPRTYPVGE